MIHDLTVINDMNIHIPRNLILDEGVIKYNIRKIKIRNKII